MSSREKIDSVYDFTDKALVELKAWLEPWFLRTERVTLAGPTFPEAVAALAATRALLGYWRLGETASPFADTSGHATGPADATKQTSSGAAAIATDVTGALRTGDDGAVQFNSLDNGEFLRSSDPTPRRFEFTTGAAMTLATWVKPQAGTLGYPATVLGQWFHSTSFGDCGYRLGINYPALTPYFQRKDVSATSVTVTGPAMAAGAWYFVVGTYDTTDGHRLYVNGDLVDSNAITSNTNLPGFGTGVSFAWGTEGGTQASQFLGVMDEVSVWGVALTSDEIRTLHQAGVGAAPGAGTVWHHGSGAPSSGLGDDNSYYLDTATGDVWFKTAGAWSTIWDAP